MAKRGPKKPAPPPPIVVVSGSPWPDFEPPAKLTKAVGLEFARLGDLLQARGLADQVDPSLVLTAARTKVLLDRSLDELEAAENLSLESPNGAAQQHPSLKTVNSLTLRVKSLWDSLGLTPQSSRRLNNGHAIPPTSDPKWDGLLNDSG